MDIPSSDSEDDEDAPSTGRYVKTTAKVDLVKFQHDASGIDHKNVVEIDRHSIPAGGQKNMVNGHPSQGIYNLTVVSPSEEEEDEEDEEEGEEGEEAEEGEDEEEGEEGDEAEEGEGEEVEESAE